MTKRLIWISFTVSVLLFVGGFFVPPMGIIDGSLLKAVGLLLGFNTLAVARDAIRQGLSTKFSHGDSSVEIKGGVPEGKREDNE